MTSTHPDWREIHRMSDYRFHTGIANSYNNFDIPIIDKFVADYDNDSRIYWFMPAEVKPYLCIRL